MRTHPIREATYEDHPTSAEDGTTPCSPRVASSPVVLQLCPPRVHPVYIGATNVAASTTLPTCVPANAPAKVASTYSTNGLSQHFSMPTFFRPATPAPYHTNPPDGIPERVTDGLLAKGGDLEPPTPTMNHPRAMHAPHGANLSGTG